MMQNQTHTAKPSSVRRGAKAASAKRPARPARAAGGADAEDERDAIIGRVVVGKPGSQAWARRKLLKVLGRLRNKGLHLKFVITPGGFVKAPFPAEWNGDSGWNPEKSDLKSLEKYAEGILSNVVTDEVRKAAKGNVDVLTIGIDLSSGKALPHAELVAIFDLRSEKTFWTGKSYPTSGQQNRLVHVVNLETHLLKLAGEKVLVLGCHDLNMFSPRSQANRKSDSLRSKRSSEMSKLVRKFKPTVVLHHPHSTDSDRIWSVAWSNVRRKKGGFSKVKAWASGIAYYNRNGAARAPRDTVLEKTRGGATTVDL